MPDPGQAAEILRLQNEVAKKDSSSQQLNNVIKQLQSKLQEKITELEDVKIDKDKFKELYEEYSEKLAKIEVGLETGNLEMGSLE